MTRYATAAAFRQALEDRLARQAIEGGLALDRLRRRVLFERILVRLDSDQPGTWILKGGMALEARLGKRARTTRDLDVVTRIMPTDAVALRDWLIRALTADPEGDRFVFAVSTPTELADDEAGRPGWRVSVDGRLAGRQFGSVRVDIVARATEISSTERLTFPNTLAFDGFPDHEFELASSSQHFAEKLHALTRDYGRENTRTRDLVLSDQFIDQLVSDVRGGHYPAVNDAHLRRTRVVVPPVAIQEQLIDRLTHLRDRFDRLVPLTARQRSLIAGLVPASLDAELGPL